MKDGYRVIDCNRHVIEPRDLWEQAPIMGAPLGFVAHPAYRNAFARAVRQGFNVESNLDDMDLQGIDVALLLPTQGLHVIWADHIEAGLSGTLCRAYNNWLNDYCRTAGSRLKGVALLPLQDPNEAAAELERTVSQFGFVAGLIRSNPLAGRHLHDPAYDPLYRRAEALNVPLLVVQMTGTVLSQMGADRYHTPFAQEAVAAPFESWVASLSLLGQGVCERFPGLRTGLIGAGCGWLPYWLERLDEHWGGPFGRDAAVAQAPGHLFKRGMVVAADPWERTVPEALSEAPDNVVWGSHYPLPQALIGFSTEVERLTGDETLSRSQKEQLLWRNASRFFRIEA